MGLCNGRPGLYLNPYISSKFVSFGVSIKAEPTLCNSLSSHTEMFLCYKGRFSVYEMSASNSKGEEGRGEKGDARGGDPFLFGAHACR